jgi:hypothetical protein
MSQLELRNLSNNEEVVVPPEGLIFGREGGDADVALEDNSISRRQAKICVKNGAWILETLAVPQGQRAPRPLTLEEGAVFNIGETEFEVLLLNLDADPASLTIPPSKAMKAMPPVKAAAKPAPAAGRKESVPPSAGRGAPVGKAPAAASAGEAPAGGGIKGLFVGVPKGIAYYLVNVPKMLVNPIGTVRKTIAELPTPALAKTDLIGYALPALFISALLPSVAVGISTLISGGGFVFSAFVPIVPAISAIIGAVVTGFVFHPVFKWIIDKMQGQSTDESRSNYFLQLMTLSIVTAVPTALSVLIAPFRFVNMLGPLLGLVATLASLFALYQWMVHFEVNKWVPKIVLGLGALAVLGALWGVIQMGLVNLRGAPSGASGIADSSEAKEAMEKAQAMADEAKENAAEAIEKNKGKIDEMKQKTQEKLAAAKDKVGKETEVAKDTAKEVLKDAKETVKVATKDAPEAVKTLVADAKIEAPKTDSAESPRAPRALAPVLTEQFGNSAFGRFAAHRAALEASLALDPTLLSKQEPLAELYGAYLESTAAVEKKWAKERNKNADRAKLYEYLKQADLYEKTGAQVEALSQKLGLR